RPISRTDSLAFLITPTAPPVIYALSLHDALPIWKAAEAVASQLRQALGSFPALPLASEHDPRSTLTSWLTGESLPEGLSLGEECELRERLDSGAVAKLQRHELRGEEVDHHLQAGKQVTRLGLVLDGQLSFLLGDDLIVRKLRLL